MVISKFKEKYRNQGKCITELKHGSKQKVRMSKYEIRVQIRIKIVRKSRNRNKQHHDKRNSLSN